MLEEHRQDFLGYQENSTEMLSKILYHVQSSNIDNANGADNSVSAGRKRKGVHSDTDPQDRSRRSARLSGPPLIGIPDHLDENSASTPRACSTSIFDTRSDKLEELVSEVPSVESDTGPGVSVAMGQGRIRETYGSCIKIKQT